MNPKNDPDIIAITNWSRASDDSDLEEEIRRLERCKQGAIGCAAILLAIAVAAVYAVFAA